MKHSGCLGFFVCFLTSYLNFPEKERPLPLIAAISWYYFMLLKSFLVGCFNSLA